MTIAFQSQTNEAVGASYDQAHARWLRFAGGEAQCAFEGAVTALLRPGATVMDAACGTGTVARRLLRNVGGTVELVLLDNSTKVLDRCADISADRVHGCMTNLPFTADQFDLVTCAWGIETLDDPGSALTEFVRVTRHGGHVCLVFCADRPARSIFGAACRHRITASGRGRFLDNQAMHKMARMAGAKYIQTLHCTGPAAAMILHV